MLEASIRYDFPEELKKRTTDVLIFGRFRTEQGEELQCWMSCFWERHGHEKEIKEGWLACIAEGIWCAEAIAWIDIPETFRAK